jgi:hypothetical protein
MMHQTSPGVANRPRIVTWFSCGTASAVTAKLTLSLYSETHDVCIARCVVPEEHPDNDRFAAECAKWFGQPVLDLRSADYANCEAVWRHQRYMAGPGGARCSKEMKKHVRQAFERDWMPDLQAFGYTVDEKRRVDRFRQHNPDVRLVTPLITAGLNKEACHAIVNRAGIQLPAMYRLGFANANCIGCVMAEMPRYWNRVRRHFPEVFAARAKLSRELGVRLVRLNRETRIFLDELDPALDIGDAEPEMECSLLCYAAEQTIQEVEDVR